MNNQKKHSNKTNTKVKKNKSTATPGQTREEEQITNQDEQKEIVNEPNIKTDREEE